MFTGIIQATGRVTRSEPRGGDLRLGIVAPEFDTSDVGLGDSIAVSGCCLTVVAHEGDTLAFDISNESLALTTLGDLAMGDRVNLEKALRLSDRPRRRHRQHRCRRIRCAFAALDPRGATGTGSLYRGQGFGVRGWRQPDCQYGGWCALRREFDSAYGLAHHVRRPSRGRSRESRNRHAGALRRAASFLRSSMIA